MREIIDNLISISEGLEGGIEKFFKSLENGRSVIEDLSLRELDEIYDKYFFDMPDFDERVAKSIIKGIPYIQANASELVDDEKFLGLSFLSRDTNNETAVYKKFWELLTSLVNTTTTWLDDSENRQHKILGIINNQLPKELKRRVN